MTTRNISNDSESVWTNLMQILCSRHRNNARNGRPTDYSIGDLRIDHYSSYNSLPYFRQILDNLATMHAEIQIDGAIIRLTNYGLNNCHRFDSTFQKDFHPFI
jgi:hypothetical protein